MFPGFISIYKDNDKRVHVYFFQGIGDNNKPIYRPLDLSHIKEEYKFNELEDGAIDYIFTNPFLSSVSCKLVEISTGNVKNININI